jgi:hypothetical protein
MSHQRTLKVSTNMKTRKSRAMTYPAFVKGLVSRKNDERRTLLNASEDWRPREPSFSFAAEAA